MDNENYQLSQTQPSIHFGHLSAVLIAIVLLLGISWMKNPNLFNWKKNQPAVVAADVPRYYAYVAPPEDLPKPAVLGANTNQGPSIIQDDGTVVPVDMGQVLAASTQGVELALNEVKVNVVPESGAAAKKYFSDAQAIESGAIGDANFAGALTSGDQNQINAQAQKITSVRDNLQKLPVPQGLIKLQQLKIIQYNSAIALLQNFTQADKNPELVNENLQQFLKSQADLDAENIVVAQKYPTENPNSALYLNSETAPANIQPATASADNSQTILNNSDNGNAGQ